MTKCAGSVFVESADHQSLNLQFAMFIHSIADY